MNATFSRPRRHALFSAAILGLAPLAARAETIANVLVNPEAETNSLTGWKAVSGYSLPIVDNGSFDFPLLPATGLYDFAGGPATPQAAATQTYTYSPYTLPFPLVDAQLVTAHITYVERSLAQSPPDNAFVFTQQFDSSSTLVGTTIDGAPANTSAWGARGYDSSVLPGSRSMSYTMNFVRNSGGDLDAFIDTNSLTFSYAGSAWNGSANNHLWSTPANWNSGLPAQNAAAVLTAPGSADSVSLNVSTASPLSYLILDGAANMTLNQSANAMNASTEFVGSSHVGSYVQSGGSNTAGSLYIAPYPGSAGTYTLSGGSLSASTLTLGAPVIVPPIGVGALLVSGGVASVTNLSMFLGSLLSLSGGTLSISAYLPAIGSTFAWSGGTFNVNSPITLDGFSFPGSLALNGSQSAHFTGAGTLQINSAAGTLTASNAALVFASASSSITQSGAGTVTIGSADTPRNLYIANFNASQNYTLNNPAASLVVHGTMYLGGTDTTSGTGTSFFTLNAGSASIDNLVVRAAGIIQLSGGSLACTTLDLSTPLASLYWFSGSLTLNYGSILAPQGLIVPSAGTLGGSGSYVGNVTLNGNLALTRVADDFSVHGTVSGTGSISLAPYTSLTADSLLVNSLSVAGSLRIRPAASTSVVKVANLVLAGASNSWTGKIDLTSNALIVQSSTLGKPSTAAALANMLTFARNSGAAGLWSGNGITSATVAINNAATGSHALTLALVDNADLNLASYAGQTLDANSLLITPALLGDANLDHNVDLADYDLWYKHVGAAGSATSRGDFNLDNNIDLADYDAWYQHVGAAFPLTPQFSSLTPSPIPEPSSLMLLAVAFPLLARRRR